jgi:hypothetical protein
MRKRQSMSSMEGGGMTSTPSYLKSGEIEPTIQRVLAWLEKSGLQVFWGELEHDPGVLVATWDTELVSDFEPFLVLAKTSEARVIYMDCTQCVTEGLAEASPDLDRLAATLAPHVGELVEATLSWVGGSVVHSMTLSASWADDYFAAWQLAEGESEEAEDDESDEELNEEDVRRHAEQLARDPKFQAARSSAQRAFAARKILDDSVRVDRALLEAVLDEAKNIFELEIKPDVDRRLADEVQALKEQGLTKSQIARKLGISANRMKTMF